MLPDKFILPEVILTLLIVALAPLLTWVIKFPGAAVKLVLPVNLITAVLVIVAPYQKLPGPNTLTSSPST